MLEALQGAARRVVDAVGVELVELALRGSGKRRVLRIDIDRAGPHGVNLDDCKAVSDALGELLESEELFQDRFTLEVSSPGIDRPIRTDDDLRRNTGRRVRATTATAIDGRVQFRGLLRGSTATDLQLDEDDLGPLALPRRQILSLKQDTEF